MIGKKIFNIFSTVLMICLSAGLVLASAGCATSPLAGLSTGIPSGTSFPVTMNDDLGRTVTVAKAPQRIISLAPSNTEIIYALGLQDKLVGDTIYCDYPEAAKSKEHVGGFADIDVEKVVSLQPDLVLGGDIHKQAIFPALEKLGITCYALVPHNLDEIMISFLEIGRLTGANKEAQDIVSDMQKRMTAITDKTAKLTDAQKPRVLYVLWGEPVMSVGVDTPTHDMIAISGGTDIVTSDGFPTLSLEEVIAANPQVIICNVDPYPAGDDTVKAMWNESRLKVVDAIINGQVYGINASLTLRPVPRIIDGLEWMAAIIHPELFPRLVQTTSPSGK